MRRTLLSLLILPLAAAAATAGTASADTSTATGTGTLTIPITAHTSWTARAGAAGVFMQPQVPSSQIVFNGSTAIVTYTVASGDAQVATLTGTVGYAEDLKFSDVKTGKSVTFSALTLDLAGAQIEGTSSADGSELAIFDTAGTVATSQDEDSQTYSADSLQIDSAGAAYLNAALGTRFFAAGQVVGSFSTTFSD